MSILVVQIPERQRLTARGGPDVQTPVSGLGTEYAYVTSPDGLLLSAQGECSAALLPKASTVVAVLSDTGVSWYRMTLHKRQDGSMSACLAGCAQESGSGRRGQMTALCVAR